MLLSHHPPVDYDRTWTIGAVRVCVRCLGVAVGTTLALALWDNAPGVPVVAILAAAVPGVLDFTLHELRLSTSCQARRFLTGASFGVFVAAFLRTAVQGPLSRFVLYLCWLVLLEGACALALRCAGRLEGLLTRYEEGTRIEG
jgi:uncharacterized membrane protein